LGQKLHIKVRYRLGNAEQVHIWARPYTHGYSTPGYAAHPSPHYEKAVKENDIIDCWFFFDDAAMVDEIRVSMCDVKTRKEVITLSCRVNINWSDKNAGD